MFRPNSLTEKISWTMNDFCSFFTIILKLFPLEDIEILIFFVACPIEGTEPVEIYCGSMISSYFEKISSETCKTKKPQNSPFDAMIWFWTCNLAIEIETLLCIIIITITVCSDLPIRPPLTSEQMPTSWWIPNCCDKSLLVGTYKHGCENYQEIRSDSTLCYITHIGLPSSTTAAVEDASGAGVANKAATTTTPATK